MTTPDVPLRLEFSVEVPGPAEQVWRAIATASGISSWFLPTDMEEREGGKYVTHMGETDSPGVVTGWDPPRRFALEEPDWAALAGHEGEPVTPLATEFLVEAQSGGTCVVRVVTSAFGTGADWEREFFDEMGTYWMPFADLLRLYLTRFPGQRATTLALDADVPGRPDAVGQAMAESLGVSDVGQAVDACGLRGRVERIGEPYLLVSVTDPVPGYFSFFAMDKDGGVASVQVAAWLFGEDAPGFVERETPAWQAWLEGLPVADGAASSGHR
jgi:uncharacterized protein YndB with AHSA1/START domain